MEGNTAFIGHEKSDIEYEGVPSPQISMAMVSVGLMKSISANLNFG
jgi:hypothetical protein